MISRVPVVTTHTGGSHLYFQNAVNINSKFNTVFVIGDTTNCKTFDKNKNVYHIDFGSLVTDNLITFRQHFESFSPNPPDFEFKCFERFFLIREFMIKYNFNKVFYVDSDCIMLQNVDTLIQATPELECGMAIEEFQRYTSQLDKMTHNNGCIHNSLLTLDYVETFIRICMDIYVTKSKFELIIPKIQWFQSHRSPGVSDMTVCYLIYLFKLYDKPFFNTEHSFLYNNELCSFDHHLKTPFGYLGDETYLINPDTGYKYIEKVGDKIYATTVNGNKIRLLTLHFQGTSKLKLETLTPDQFLGLGSSSVYDGALAGSNN